MLWGNSRRPTVSAHRVSRCRCWSPPRPQPAYGHSRGVWSGYGRRADQMSTVRRPAGRRCDDQLAGQPARDERGHRAFAHRRHGRRRRTASATGSHLARAYSIATSAENARPSAQAAVKLAASARRNAEHSGTCEAPNLDHPRAARRAGGPSTRPARRSASWPRGQVRIVRRSSGISSAGASRCAIWG
jgi:hypothetical protein